MKKILSLIVALTSNLCFAYESNNFFDNEVMDKIEANKNTCVYGYTENKVYLKPDRIFPTEQGVYLNLNDVDYVLLPTLNSDSNGCYVPCVNIFNKCPGCGNEYFIRCTRSDCPLVQQQKERDKEKERAKQERKKEKKKK